MPTDLQVSKVTQGKLHRIGDLLLLAGLGRNAHEGSGEVDDVPCEVKNPVSCGHVDTVAA